MATLYQCFSHLFEFISVSVKETLTKFRSVVLSPPTSLSTLHRDPFLAGPLLPMSAILDSLNPAQAQAVQITAGPLLILAGAGSGKTKCLTHRIAYLMTQGIEGDNILAVTFTNKAANEMKSRIESLLRSTTEVQRPIMPTVGTFHAICARLLRRHIQQLQSGYDRNFVIFDTDDSRSLMKLLIKESGYSDKEIKYRAVLSHISHAKNHLISPDQLAAELESNRFTQAVKKLYPLYQKRLRDHNALDFDDLLKVTVELMEQCPTVLEQYRARWQHIMVDEYQDTNFAQYRLIRLLADPRQNLCVIGDDHQSIYSFRGADYTNILNFNKDFPQAAVIKLTRNYRSTGHILDCANSLISHNRTGHQKELWTEENDGDKVQIVEVRNEKEEGNEIAKDIKDYVREQGGDYHSCAILYRMNAQSRAIEEALLRLQIPYQIVGGVRFFDRREIKDLIAYLRLIFNPRDDLAFLRIINVPKRKIGKTTLEALGEYARAYTMGLLEVCQDAAELTFLNASKRKTLQDFADMILKFRQQYGTKPISILLDRLIEHIKFLEHLDDGTAEGESRQQNVRELFSVAGRYDTADEPLAAFLEGVALMSDTDKLNDADDRVTLMTIHSSKGLEFPRVYLPGWEEGIIPSQSSQLHFEGVEEERRLGYVAITRAEAHLRIYHTRQRMLYGRTEIASPSSFLRELTDSATQVHSYGASADGHYASWLTSGTSFSTPPVNRSRVQTPLSRATRDAPTPEPFSDETPDAVNLRPGDKIEHQSWGNGTVVAVRGDVLSVSFASKGLKKLVASVAPIRKCLE